MTRIYRHNFIVAALALVATVSISCSRKSESTQISMTMPDWSKLTNRSKAQAQSAVTVVSRVMINVSAPDITSPIVYIWEMNDQNTQSGTYPTPPSEFVLNVPRGGDRLIQVLAITEEMDSSSSGSSGAMIFYYGDSRKSLLNSVEDVPVQLAAINSSSGEEGSISGRYFAADGSTPTGRVDMYYAPAGKRPMIVERTWMFAGYFHFFLLENVPFTYQMENGLRLFESVTAGSFAGSLGAERTHIAIPSAYREYGGGTFKAKPASRKVAGFFGPGAGLVSREICYESSPQSISGLYSDAAGTNAISWDPNSTQSTAARVIGGGTAATGGQCVSHTDFGINTFSINLDQLKNGDSPIGNRGPFREFDPGSGWDTFLDVQKSGTSLNVQWEYLPQAIGRGVDGVGLFYKVYEQNENMNDRWHDNAPCNSMASFGFTEVTRIAASSSSSPVSEYTWSSAPIAAFDAGRLKTVICPYSNSRAGYYEFALSHYNYGSGGSYPKATQILASSLTEPTALNSAGAPQKIAESTCTQVHLRFADANGNLAYRDGASGSPEFQVTVTAGAVSNILYRDLECTDPSGGASNDIYSAHSGEITFGVLLPMASAGATLQISDVTTGGTQLPTISYHVTKVAPTSRTHIKSFILGGKTDISTWQCYPISHVRGVPDGADFIGQNGSPSSSFSAPTDPDLTYFDDPQCESSIGNAGSFAGESPVANVRFFRYVGSLSSLALDLSTNLEGLSSLPFNVTVSQPANPTRLEFMPLENTLATACIKVRLVAKNNQNQYSPVTSAQTVTPTLSIAPTAGEGFFSDSGCTSSISSIGIPSGQPQSGVIYFRWNSPAALTVGGSSSGLNVESRNWPIQP